MRVRLRDINVVELNSRTVILFTQYVRVAAKEGADLKMQYPDIVKRVFGHAKTTRNPELIVLSMRIKRQLIRHVQTVDIENCSFSLYPDLVST